MSAESGHPPADAPPQRRLSDLLGRYFLVVLLLLLVAAFSFAVPRFFTFDNLTSMLIRVITVVFAAVALMAPLIVGELDLSIGNAIGLGQGLVVFLITVTHLSVPASIALTLLCCVALGLVNGLLVVRFEINSLIATLATGTIVNGIVLWFTGGSALGEGLPESFAQIADWTVLGIPMMIWYGLIVIALVEFTLQFHPIGRRMYAVGGNRRAAMLTGIPVSLLIVGAFVLSAAGSGLGGIVLAAHLQSASPATGPNFLLPAFAAAFLGATTVRPGRYNALGAVVAVLTIEVITSGLQQLGVPDWANYIVYGVALAGGVGIARHLTRLREEQARRDQLRALKESRR